VLLASNSEKKRPIAGLAKIAAAKVALDWAKVSQTPLTTMVTVPDTALYFLGANPMGLHPGDRLSMRDAIYSAMLGSDDMAMHALAFHIGQALLVRRQRQGDPQKTFVKEMNTLAHTLGMRRTHFATPYGLHQSSWKKTYSTAADMARLTVYSMRDSGFTFYVKQKSRKISVLTAQGGSRSYTVHNTNKLLGELQINGVKTGLSADAGQCLAVNSHKTPVVTKLGDGRSRVRRRDLVVVVLGSLDRFNQARMLVNQGWKAFDQWGTAGYPVSENKREYLIVPQLH
jgi:D-alanyl-D-alanine carboxypeptidase (penicillin-binding protein 5/6)